MKAHSTALKAHTAGGTTTMVACWKATLLDGTVIRATSLDVQIEYPVGSGEIYLPALSFNPSDVESGDNMAPDNLEVEGFLASPSITEADIHSGHWDFATIEFFNVNYRDLTQGPDEVRKGTLGEVRGGRSKFTAELRGLLQALTRKIVGLTTKDCSTDLGSTKCKIVLADWTITGTVDSVTGNRIISDAGRTEAADWFTGAKLTWLTGANAGRSMEVKRSAVGEIELHHPMYDEIAEGDTYSLHAGCMKRFTEDCVGKFNNAVNFRGFPYLPGNKIYRAPGQTYGDE